MTGVRGKNLANARQPTAFPSTHTVLIVLFIITEAELIHFSFFQRAQPNYIIQSLTARFFRRSAEEAGHSTAPASQTQKPDIIHRFTRGRQRRFCGRFQRSVNSAVN